MNRFFKIRFFSSGLYHALLMFSLSIPLVGIYANHDPIQVRVIQTPNGLALIDESDQAEPFFEVEHAAAPILSWALASALSLDTSLHVKHVDNEDYIVVGSQGDIGSFFIDARYMSQERRYIADDNDHGQSCIVEYFFEKDGHRFKIFSHNSEEKSLFRNIFVEAATKGGLIALAADTNLLADWQGEARRFNPDNWVLRGQEYIRVAHLPFVNLVRLEPSPELNKIAFKKILRKDPSLPRFFYRATKSNLVVAAPQKALIRKLEIELRHFGGSIFCVNTPLLHQTCFRAGPNFSLEWTRKYNEIDVRRVLWLSVEPKLPAHTFDPIILDDGTVILPAISGKDEKEITTKIRNTLSLFSLSIVQTTRFALPIKYCGHWVAVVVERGQNKTKLTYMHSLRTLDKTAFSVIKYAMQTTLSEDNLSSPRISTHHIQPEDDQDSDGLVMIENLLRYLGISGPVLPLLLEAEHIQEVHQGHRELLRFNGQRFGHTSPRHYGPLDDPESPRALPLEVRLMSFAERLSL